MRFILFCFSLVLAACANEESGLVILATSGSKVENGKTLDMRFEEVERNEKSSIVVVTFNSGGSVSSSMFIMKGMCSVTRARGEKFFVSKDLGTNGSRYELTFPQSITPEQSDPLSDNHVSSLDECSILGM